ncbi:hypothetical protein [Chondromyces crocatus]|uniref:Uncharacterized protein n=1 Tax=Chondromyces crocatus TaxID=52 RepID=A0A0K1ESL6_CHOCO|nr:hypothetical protein [Chondromyces crocatus]AKT43794.1 uncharacterized protein CMC5_080310 [Chondromyces crocatus]
MSTGGSSRAGYLLSAAAGAAATVLVHQVVAIGGATAQPAPAATEQAIAPPSPKPPAERPPTSPSKESPPRRAIGQLVTEKEKEISRLQEELRGLRAEAGYTQERIEALEGTPQPWPADIPAGFREKPLEANFQAVLEKHKLGDLVDMECDEFPCIAVVKASEADPQWQQKFQAALKEMSASPEYGGKVGLSMWSNDVQQDDQKTRYTAVSMAPPGTADGEDARTRSGHRARGMLSDATTPQQQRGAP